jgi:hypothetical protein
LHVLSLVAVKNKRIIIVKAVIVLAGIFGTFKAILQISVPDTARCHRAGRRTRAVLETTLAIALQMVST